MQQVRQWHFLAMILTAAFLAGCMTQPSKPMTTLDYLQHAEAVMESGWETLGRAIQIGRVEINSDRHVQFYTILDKADAALDAAWDAYAGGDTVTATQQADLAVAIYMQIRPALLEAAGEQ